MKKLSTNAGLSTKYTNHSIRSTVITAWDANNIEARHIIGISGHKSEETIKSYSKKCPAKKKRQMADILSEKLGNPPKKCKPSGPEDRNDEPPPNQGSTAVAPDIANVEFEDWVPIENNKDDFVLADILSVIEKENAKVSIPQENQVAVPSTSNIQTTMPPTMATPLNTQNPNVVNFNQAQSFPIVPKMYFPQSNVTINYNFQGKN